MYKRLNWFSVLEFLILSFQLIFWMPQEVYLDLCT